MGWGGGVSPVTFPWVRARWMSCRPLSQIVFHQGGDRDSISSSTCSGTGFSGATLGGTGWLLFVWDRWLARVRTVSTGNCNPWGTTNASDVFVWAGGTLGVDRNVGPRVTGPVRKISLGRGIRGIVDGGSLVVTVRSPSFVPGYGILFVDRMALKGFNTPVGGIPDDASGGDPDGLRPLFRRGRCIIRCMSLGGTAVMIVCFALRRFFFDAAVALGMGTFVRGSEDVVEERVLERIQRRL